MVTVTVDPTQNSSVDLSGGSGNVGIPTKAGGADVKPKEGPLAERILEHIQTPAPVRALLAGLGSLTAEEQSRLERHFKLSYLFGGFDVACKNTPDGTLIVSSGPGHEVAAKLAALSDEEFEGIYLERPLSWNSATAQIPHGTRTR